MNDDKVHFESDNINGWPSENWFKDMGSECKVYLLSEERKIPESNLPDHIAGSYHVVDGNKVI